MSIQRTLSLAILGLVAHASTAENIHQLPLQLSHKTYQNMWQEFQLKKSQLVQLDQNSETAIDGGTKLSKWIALLNEKRAPEDKIYLTSEGTRKGIPIDKPSIYGPKQIRETLTTLQSELPAEINDVVYGNLPISDTLPVSKEDFITYGRKIDRLYQTAVRWEVVVKPNIGWYTNRSKADVRGYYYLKGLDDVDATLQDYFNLDDAQKEKLQNALIVLCMNSNVSRNVCAERFNQATLQQNKLVTFKNTYWQAAKANWNSFFDISRPRYDVTWTGNSMYMPFTMPQKAKIKDWLKDNVEDEFKYNDWSFHIDYVPSALSHLEFQAGTTPHVSSGNIIVMDKNTDLDEYEVKWTIRHEYGHILRLPDCYVEFYDTSINAAVNYQLDVTDLMCSRAGNMNDRIYKELKRVYQ